MELIHKYPDLDLIVGTNEYSAVGAANAIKDMRLTGKIKMVGFDNSIEEVQLLEEGVFVGIYFDFLFLSKKNDRAVIDLDG